MRIALVTSHEWPALAPTDQMLLAALARRGVDALPTVWDDPAVPWATFDAAVIRSTWDYHLRLPEFLAWAERVAALTALWNPLPVVRWNTHKGYLRDLATRGVPIVPTEWLAAGGRADLAGLRAARGWTDVVVKPAVSASAEGTMLVTAATLDAGETHLAARLPGQDMMVQPYMPSVAGYGERSFLFAGPLLTHAVRRVPVLDAPGLLATAPSDDAPPWIGQQVTPTAGEAALAAAIVAAVGQPILYARVDLVRDEADQPVLLELELVEPNLFFETVPAAADALAAEIVRRVKRET